MNETLEITVHITPLRLVASLALAFIVAWAYNAHIIDHLEIGDNPKWARAAWEVVGGVSFVIFIFTIGIDSLAIGALLFLYFIAAGIPMIRGSDRRAKIGRRHAKTS